MKRLINTYSWCLSTFSWLRARGRVELGTMLCLLLCHLLQLLLKLLSLLQELLFPARWWGSRRWRLTWCKRGRQQRGVGLRTPCSWPSHWGLRHFRWGYRCWSWLQHNLLRWERSLWFNWPLLCWKINWTLKAFSKFII